VGVNTPAPAISSLRNPCARALALPDAGYADNQLCRGNEKGLHQNMKALREKTRRAADYGYGYGYGYD
jgi:hypothetical protein